MQKRLFYNKDTMKEKHHIIPISLGGPDIKENIRLIDKETHKQIHNILNIPYGKIRKLRSLENEIDLDRKQVEYLKLDLQKEYFENLPKLPPKIIKIHVKSLLEQITYYRIQIIYEKLKAIKEKHEKELYKTLYMNSNK